MKHRTIRYRSLAALLLLSACASGPKVAGYTDPWQVDKKEFLRYAKVIALADVYLPDGMPDPEPITQNFGDLIESRLRAAGYTVFRPQQYKTTWDRIVASMGGISDSLGTGHDPRKMAQAMSQTLDELDAGFDLDAVLVPRIVVVEAVFASGRAAWDGATQSVRVGGAVKGFFSGSPEGTLGALSLSVALTSPHGRTLFAHAGGIEVLSKIEGKTFVPVSRAELFTDQERIEKSVDLALRPLFD
jgi:hypothetical protein